MPPRLSKRQQRELEELQALQPDPALEPEIDQVEESADEVPVKVVSGFAAVNIISIVLNNCLNIC
jgi:hypothetical protein